MKKLYLLFFFYLFSGHNGYSQHFANFPSMNIQTRYLDSFYFTSIIDSIPYIQMDSKMLNYIQAGIINSQSGIRSFEQHPNIKIDKENFKSIKGLILDVDVKCFEISKMFPYDLMKETFAIQLPGKNGAGDIREIIPDKILYCVGKRATSIVIQCKPMDLPLEGLKWFFGFRAPLPTHRHRWAGQFNWPSDIPKGLNNDTIPKVILDTTKSLWKEFTKPLWKSAMNDSNLTITPIRLFRHKKEEIYYCAIFSYGHKGYASELYLFNYQGTILQKIKNDEYVKILGLTDTNWDGSHELIVHYSSGDYSGGVAIFDIVFFGLQPQLVLKLKKSVYWD